MASEIRKLLPAMALIIVSAVAAWGISAAMRNRSAPAQEDQFSGQLGDAAAKNDGNLQKKFPVIIRHPEGPPIVDSGMLDFHGQSVMIACSTCHATQPPNTQTRTTADLDQFHKGLHVAHGNLSCLSCHNQNDYDSLRLADGTRLEFRDVMQLCAQCHGPQARDYQNGAHGGMTGHWDLSRGPRQRNNCIDCHDPHVPAYPTVRPVFPPIDRFPAAGAAH